MDQHFVARRLVVPGEAIAGMADLVDAAVEGDPGERFGSGDWPGAAGADRDRRVAAGWREQRQDVGEQKLLVLLLVIDADLDEPRDLARRIDAAREERMQGLVDMGAIGKNLVGSAASGARVSAAAAARPGSRNTS